MDLPPALRAALEHALAGVKTADLVAATDALSGRYRSEMRDGRFHVADDLSASAYLAARFPATYGAVRSALRHVALARPAFSPRTLLDVGSGPGTALWAAADAFPSLQDALLIEGSPAMRRWGERLAAELNVTREWRTHDVAKGLPGAPPRDLVTLAYVLDELEPAERDALVRALWAQTGDTLLLVEPGTPAGYARILRARALLLEAGAHLVAPCPHAGACPLVAPDWCHFAARIPRSSLHRRTKSADLGWEDEKYSYVAASRSPAATEYDRVLAPPQGRSGLVSLKLCTKEGRAETRRLSKRDGDAYKRARRLGWGDAL